MEIKLDLTGMSFEQQKELLLLQKDLLDADNKKEMLKHEVWEDYIMWVKEGEDAYASIKRFVTYYSWDRFCKTHDIKYLSDLTPYKYAKSKNTKYSGTVPVNPDIEQVNHKETLEAINNHSKTVKEGLKSIAEKPAISSSGGGVKFNPDNYVMMGVNLCKRDSYYHD